MNRVIAGIVIGVLALLVFAQLAFSYYETKEELETLKAKLPGARAEKIQDR